LVGQPHRCIAGSPIASTRPHKFTTTAYINPIILTPIIISLFVDNAKYVRGIPFLNSLIELCIQNIKFEDFFLVVAFVVNEMDDNKRIFPPFTYFIKRRKENTEIERKNFFA
jgi:hypothetical protein